MDSRRFEYYSKILHPFIAIYLPFSFLSLFVLLLVGRLLERYVLFPPFFPVVMLIAAFSEVLVGNLLNRERVAGIGPRIREYVFVLALCLGISYLLLLVNTGAGSPVSLNVKLVLCGILASLQWILTLYIHHNLQYRLFFLKPFRDKPVEQYRQVYQEFGHEAAESLQAVGKVIRINSVFTVFIFVAVVISAWLLHLRLRSWETVLLAGYFIFGFFIRANLNSYLEEQQLYMEGLLPDSGQHKSRTILMVVFIAVLSVTGIVSAGEKAPVPDSVLVDFYHWLSALLQASEKPVERETQIVIPESRPQENPYGNQMDALQGMGDSGPDLSWLTKTIGYTVLAALAVAAVMFIFRPFIRGGESLYFLRSLFRSMKEMSGNLKYIGARFLAFFKGGGKEKQDTYVQRLKADRSRQSERNARRQPKGLAEILFGNRLLKAFIRMTKWATKQGVPFEFSIAPLEYATMITDKFPVTTPEVTRIAVLFERSEFSSRGIDDTEREEYLRAVRALVKTKPNTRG